MTAAEPRRLGRSTVSVVAGFLTTAVLSVAGDIVMHATGVFPPMGQTMSGPLFVLAISYRTVFTFLGGAVTAWLAPRSPMRHAMVLAAFGTLAGVAGILVWVRGGPEMGPAWYAILIAVEAAPCVLAGAALAQRRAG